MRTEDWVAVALLLVLASLSGCWWISHHLYRKQNNTKVIEEGRQNLLKRQELFTPNEAREIALPKPEPLDILTSAKDDAHPNEKHLMIFKKKFFSHDFSAIVYKFECLYCRFEAVLTFKDFWGTPKPRVYGGLTEEWANWGRRKYEVGVNSGLLYVPQDGQMRIGEFKQPQPPQTDRSDAMLMNLMAYAEFAKQNPIPEDLWGGEHRIPDDLIGLYEQDERGVWHPTEKGKRRNP